MLQQVTYEENTMMQFLDWIYSKNAWPGRNEQTNLHCGRIAQVPWPGVNACSVLERI